MVYSKRISCIVLSVLLTFAVCAPCALGVFADGSITPTDHMSRSDQYSLYGFSCDPDYFVYSANYLLGYYNGGPAYKTYNGPAIACAFHMTSRDNLSQFCLICPYGGSGFTQQEAHDNIVYYRGPAMCEGFIVTVNGVSFYVGTGITNYSTNFTDLNVPLLEYTGTYSVQNMVAALLSDSGVSFEEPEPEEPVPEPSDDGWTYGSTDLYFTNISDSSFTFNQTNYPFSSFPSKDIIVDDSPSKIIAGAFWDDTSWLSSGSTISGQLQVQFTSPLTSVDNFIQRGFIWFVNGSDPSLSGFQYYEVPTSWEYVFTVWKYGVNQWTNEYIFNFEFTLPDDLQTAIGFTPVNILIGLYGILPSGSFTTECWYNVQNLVFGYYVPPSSGEPEVPPTPVFNNPDNGSTSIYPSQPTATDNLNTELGFYDNVWKSYNITTDTFINFFEEVVGFGYTNLDDALGRLYQAFSYTGSGSIKLPSATIPWGDSTLQLWEEQDIPLAYWFSNLPSPIKTVFGFIIVFSVASACWGIAFFFIRKIVSGNYQTNDL